MNTRLPTALALGHRFASLDIERATLRGVAEVLDGNSLRGDQLARALRTASVVLLGTRGGLDTATIATMSSCRAIIRYGIGVDNIAVDQATAQGIPVINVPEYCISEVSDHVVALILAANRRLIPSSQAARRGESNSSAFKREAGRGSNSSSLKAEAGQGSNSSPLKGEAGRGSHSSPLKGEAGRGSNSSPLKGEVGRGWGPQIMKGTLRLATLTVGIVGFGRIGQEIARKLLPLVARILVYDPLLPDEDVLHKGALPTDFDSMLGASDFVTINCPLTPETRHMFNTETLAKMKPTAWLVNAARGQIIKEDDLIAALRRGQIQGAALDVLGDEPPPADSPLLHMPNVIVTPHVAWYSEDAVQDLQRLAAEQARRILAGERPQWMVNAQVWSSLSGSG
jgi:phosphoglycerate dehydrogenase-like enzyme